MQLADLFDATFAAGPDDVAIEFATPEGTRALTFGELEVRSHQLARLLQDRGLSRGERLAVFLENRIEFVDLVLACARLGVVLVPVNILYRDREIAHIVDDAEPRAVVGGRDAVDLLPSRVPLWDVDELMTAASDGPADPIRVSLDGDAPAALVYTSGTTGRSKGAILTHNNFLANAVNLAACWRITREDRYLAVLPLFHVHGLGNGLMCWLASGCRMRLAKRFEMSKAFALFEAFRPTLFFGVPTIYVRLLELPAEEARAMSPGMRLFVCGSAPLPASVLQAFRERFGHVILERYGMSETLMTLSNPYAGERRAGSVGFPLPGISVRIESETGTEAAPGEVGELLVRGPNVFRGYWRQAEATAAAFRDGWFRTGDMADRSVDGYYTLQGRRSDVIISGGFNIYPREVEEVLAATPGVREAAVVGVPDRIRGELPVAYVVADHAIDARTLEQVCRRQLAFFKVPRTFIPVEALPRNALGKVLKHLLPPPPQPPMPER
jgi:malonyl-CoA/methylmalonyl-CoA synthetase